MDTVDNQLSTSDVGARTVTNYTLTNIGFKPWKDSLPYSLSNFNKICSLCFLILIEKEHGRRSGNSSLNSL